MRRYTALYGALGLLTLGTGLGGCALPIVEEAEMMGRNLIMPSTFNLTNNSYAAADYLLQHARVYMKPYDLLKVTPLTDVESSTLTSKMGHMIPERVGTRLSQLGYRVDLSDVVSDVDTSYSDTPESDRTPHYVLMGTYMRGRREIEVNLRIVNNSNKRVIAAFDYKLPQNWEVKKLSTPEPRIFKTSQ